MGWLVLAAALLLPAPPQTASVVFDVRKTGHAVLGFGANIWPGDAAVMRAFDALGLTYARLWGGCPSPAPPADAGREAFDAYWAAAPDTATLRRTAELLNRRRVKVVYCIGSPPAEWLGFLKRLKPEYHEAFARLQASAVRRLVGLKLKPAFIELYNEPDGNWNVHVTPEENARIVKLVRAELDARGLRDVGIVGPGTSHVDWGPEGDRWVNAMDPAAVACLSAWSNHAWEWDMAAIHGEDGRRYIHAVWPRLLASYRRKDPARRLPIFITEYATKAYRFHGVTYTDQGAGRSERAASDTAAYAVRVFENTLSLLNGGAGVLIVWEGADQPWSNHEWGLLRRPERGSAPRPVFHALKTLLPRLPAGCRVVPAIRQDAEVYSAAFVKGTRLVLAMVNGTGRARTVTVRLAGVSRLRVREARMFVAGRIVPRRMQPAPGAGSLTLTLPPDSTLTVDCSYVAARARRSASDARP